LDPKLSNLFLAAPSGAFEYIHVLDKTDKQGDVERPSGPAEEHIPVLADILTEQVALPPDGIMVDATIGQGGHSFLFGQGLSSKGMIVGLDVDKNALQRSHCRLDDLACQVLLANSNFSDIDRCIQDFGLDQVDFLLADLGYSSVQLNDEHIGISFQADMPLDMRIDRSLSTTAADIVNETGEKELANLIFEYGQDRASRRIARFICQHRYKEPITTTKQLAGIVCKALYRPKQRRRARIHPATRTFQALRIAVNSELENLEKLLVAAPKRLKAGGYIAVISFHSLEDRCVKLNFRENARMDVYRLITKKPIVPTQDEIGQNRRARSAKLRIAQRL
jgi:16S rRNA (cytosine1402-N4)-methyltransferase